MAEPVNLNIGVKILHCADLHLNAPLNTVHECADVRQDELLHSLESVVDLCLDQNVQVLFIAGDLFDTPYVPENIYKFTERQLSRLEIPVFIATGNHDFYSSDSPFASIDIPNVYIFSGYQECIELSELGVRICGAGFSSRYCDEPLFSDFKFEDDNFINIVVLHGEEVSSGGVSHYNPINIELIEKSGADYCALGHIHKRTPVLKFGKMSYAYSGCVEGKGFDEVGEKGVYIGTVGKGCCNLEFKRLCKRVYHDISVDIGECENEDEIVSQIIKELPGDRITDLYRVSLVGKVSEKLEIKRTVLENRINGDFFFIKIIDKTELKIDYEILENEYSLRGFFVKNMMAKYRECLHSGNNESAEKYLLALEYGICAFDGRRRHNEN